MAYAGLDGPEMRGQLRSDGQRVPDHRRAALAARVMATLEVRRRLPASSTSRSPVLSTISRSCMRSHSPRRLSRRDLTCAVSSGLAATARDEGPPGQPGDQRTGVNVQRCRFTPNTKSLSNKSGAPTVRMSGSRWNNSRNITVISRRAR